MGQNKKWIFGIGLLLLSNKLSGVISEDFFKDRFNQVETRQVEIQEEIEQLEG